MVLEFLPMRKRGREKRGVECDDKRQSWMDGSNVIIYVIASPLHILWPCADWWHEFKCPTLSMLPRTWFEIPSMFYYSSENIRGLCTQNRYHFSYYISLPLLLLYYHIYIAYTFVFLSFKGRFQEWALPALFALRFRLVQ